MIDKKKVIELHRKGLSQGDIAAELGCSQSSVSYQLRKAAITSVPRKWVNVHDGLPPHPHPVLVTIDSYYRPRFEQIARYDHGWVIPKGIGRVVAWMELPEEYQDDEK